MSRRLLRFGFHGFLNALPLLNFLQRNGTRVGFEMVVDAPSVIAEKLLSGQHDLAMIPSIEYLRVADGFRLFPGICIASRQAVLTVLLVTKVKLSEVRSVALDNRSRTSVALLRILFESRFHPKVEYHPAVPDIAEMLKTHSAALIIGDPALNITELDQSFTIYDLSREWFALTGKAFVHAVVAVRPDILLTDDMVRTMRAAIGNVKDEITEIIKDQSKHYGAGICEDYLRHRIRYVLGEEETQGLICFRDLCHDRGLIARKHPIQYI